MNGLSMFQFRKDDTKDLVTAKPSSTSKLPNQRVAEVGSKQPQQGGQPSPKKNTPRDVGGGDDDDDDGLEARIRQRKQRVRNVSTAMSDVNKKAFGGLYESYVHEVRENTTNASNPCQNVSHISPIGQKPFSHMISFDLLNSSSFHEFPYLPTINLVILFVPRVKSFVADSMTLSVPNVFRSQSVPNAVMVVTCLHQNWNVQCATIF